MKFGKKLRGYRTLISSELFRASLKSIKIIGIRKAFCRQKNPESSCTGKETVDRDILITSRNDDRKIMQSIRISSGPATRMRKWNQFYQFR